MKDDTLKSYLSFLDGLRDSKDPPAYVEGHLWGLVYALVRTSMTMDQFLEEAKNTWVSLEIAEDILKIEDEDKDKDKKDLN